MKYFQSHSSRRKIEVRAIALIFVASGVWYLWLFLAPFLVANSDKSINPVYLIYTSFLFTAGAGLFRLREYGRILALVLLSIRAVTNVGLLVWLFIQKMESQSVAMTVIAMVVWIFVVLLIIVFLLQKATRQIFQLEEDSTTAQSSALS